MNGISALLYALLAASGNAFFAFGQKKASLSENGLTFVFYAGGVTVLLAYLAANILGSANLGSTLKTNWVWILVSGVGLFLTLLGFNLLYTRFGATGYVLYAVLSILTTSVLVGVLIFKETFNGYHWTALAFSLLTVVFFSIGESKG